MKVGELNGRWSILFRAQLAVGAVLLPTLIPWTIWVTSQMYAMKADIMLLQPTAPRYTAVMAARDHLVTRNEVLAEVDRMYPKKMQWDIAAIMTKLSAIDGRLSRLEQGANP